MIPKLKRLVTKKVKDKKNSDDDANKTVYIPLHQRRIKQRVKLLQDILVNRRDGYKHVFNSMAMILPKSCKVKYVGLYTVDFSLSPFQTKAMIFQFQENIMTNVSILDFSLSPFQTKAMIPLFKEYMTENVSILEFSLWLFQTKVMIPLLKKNVTPESVGLLDVLLSPFWTKAICSQSLDNQTAKNVLALEWLNLKTKAMSMTENVDPLDFVPVQAGAINSLSTKNSVAENVSKLYFLLSKIKGMNSTSIDKKMLNEFSLCVGFVFLENYSKVHTGHRKSSAFFLYTNNPQSIISTKYKNRNNTKYNTLSIVEDHPSRDNVGILNLSVPLPRRSFKALKLNRDRCMSEHMITYDNTLKLVPKYIPHLNMAGASKAMPLECTTKKTKNILHNIHENQQRKFSSKEREEINIYGANEYNLELACKGYNKPTSNNAVEILEAIGLMDDPSHKLRNSIAPQDIVVYPVVTDRIAYLTAAFRMEFKEFNLETRRLLTFKNFPATARIYATNLAREGFVYTGDGQNDRATCAFCNESYSNWQWGDDIKAVHRGLSRSCPMGWDKNCSNEPHLTQILPNIPMSDQRDGGTNTLTIPEEDDVTETEGRQGTADFLPVQESNCAPGSVTQEQPDEVFGDRRSSNSSGINLESEPPLTCFFCEGVLEMTENIQDVWFEHAARYPSCGFVRLKYGNNFVETLQELAEQHEQVTMEMVLEGMDLPISLGGVAVTARHPYNGNVLNSESVAVAHLLDESRQLSSRLMCRLCHEEHAQIVYQPCGHLVTCVDCSLVETACLLCEGPVDGRIRVFLE